MSNQEATRNNKKSNFSVFDFLYKYGTILTIVLLIIFFTLTSSTFLTQSNVIT